MLGTKSFDKALDQGRPLAQKYEQFGQLGPGAFVWLPVHERRTLGSWPMEYGLASWSLHNRPAQSS